MLSGLESGGINLQTCRHQAGTRITTLREHTSAVSVLNLAHDEISCLSGSWDKVIHDWDLNTGRVKRSFRGSGGQISAIERRPLSSVPIPTITEDQLELSQTFSSNNISKPSANGELLNGVGGSERKNSKTSQNGTEDAPGSPDGSLFGDDDHGSLFGDNDTANGSGGAFGEDDDDEFSRAIASGLEQTQQEDAAPGQDDEMTDINSGGPVQPPEAPTTQLQSSDTGAAVEAVDHIPIPPARLETQLSNGLPHSEEDPGATLTNGHTTDEDVQPTSDSTFLDASIDGTIRIWDRRVATPIARILPPRNTPPWCMGACWSPDGNFFYAGRRNGTVEEYSVHKGLRMAEPRRTFKFPAGSGAVSALRTMPNGRHLVW